jgi:hypothetical protein
MLVRILSMNVRLSSAVALGALSLVSCFPPEPPPYSRRSALGPSASYRGDHSRGEGYRGDGYDGGDGAYGDSNDDGARYEESGVPERTGPPSPPASPEPSAAPAKREYPVAERTNNPNQVLSPYAPYNVIDVAGFKSGQLAKDPSNGKIFRVP